MERSGDFVSFFFRPSRSRYEAFLLNFVGIMQFLLRYHLQHPLIGLSVFFFWWEYYKVVDPLPVTFANAFICTGFAMLTFYLTYYFYVPKVLTKRGFWFFLSVCVGTLIILACLRSLSIRQVFHFTITYATYWDFFRSITTSIFHLGYYITIATVVRLFIDRYETQKRLDALMKDNLSNELNYLKDQVSPQLKEDLEDSIFIKCNGQIEKIRIDDILFIKAEENYSSVFTSKNKFLTLTNLKAMEENLAKYSQFLRVHKSYIISLLKVDKITFDTLMIGHHVIPFSRTVKKRLKEYFKT